jgi:D-alanine transaminase
MPDITCLNGQRVEAHQALLPVDDRGFLFGDAVYEVLRSYDGRLWAVERHLRRLEHSLETAGIRGVDRRSLRALMERASAESGYANAHVYVHITAGVEARVLARGPGLNPTVLVRVREAAAVSSPEVFTRGVRAVTLPDLRWKRCDVKSTNLLANVLARTEARRAGAYEAILYDANDYVTEAAAMSVFGVESGTVYTRPLGPEVLASITRGFLIEIARDAGLPVHEEAFPRDRLREMQEVILTSTSHEVCPAIALDGVPVGDGRVGPIARQLWAGFQERVAARDDAPR